MGINIYRDRYSTGIFYISYIFRLHFGLLLFSFRFRFRFRFRLAFAEIIEERNSSFDLNTHLHKCRNIEKVTYI